MSKYTAVYAGNVVGIYKDGEQITIDQIVADLNAKAVEPVQAVPVGYCLMPREPTQWMREQIACGIESNSVADVWGRLIRAVDIENKHRAKEPAQAVPAFWASENILKESLRDNISCILTTTKCAANTVPLYTTPPAIVEAVPVAWLPIETAPKDGTEILVTYGKQGFVMQLVRFDRTFNYWKNKGEAELGLENNATNWMPIPDPRKPLYTASPAIDETRHKLILVCEYLETVGLMFVSPRVISSQIRAILEAGNGE